MSGLSNTKKHERDDDSDLEENLIGKIPRFLSNKEEKELLNFELFQFTPEPTSQNKSDGPTVKKDITKANRLNPVTFQRLRKPIPSRNSKGNLFFKDFPEFSPNMTPKEILQSGSFGGTMFQTFTSTVNSKVYSGAWEEFPSDWFENLRLGWEYGSAICCKEYNFYHVHSDGNLREWEESGWISDADPYGWFQWYCRFYLGRRSSDDHRQISRALRVMGPTGRWKRNLINKCLNSGLAPAAALIDYSIAPKVRQSLQHWGYKLTLEDLVSPSTTKLSSSASKQKKLLLDKE